MLHQLSDRVWYLPHEPSSDRPVLGYIRGDRYSFMVDAGASGAHSALFMDALAASGLRAPDFVGVTHWHWDHTYALSSIPAVSVACALTNRQLIKMSRWSFDDAAMTARVENGEESAFCSDMIKKEYPDRSRICVRSADLTFDDRLTIDLGGVTCRLLRVGGSHCEDSTVFYIPEEKILFLGDCFCADLYHGEVYYKEKHRALTQALKSLDFERCVPGHWQHLTRAELIEELETQLNRLQK